MKILKYFINTIKSSKKSIHSYNPEIFNDTLYVGDKDVLLIIDNSISSFNFYIFII